MDNDDVCEKKTRFVRDFSLAYQMYHRLLINNPWRDLLLRWELFYLQGIIAAAGLPAIYTAEEYRDMLHDFPGDDDFEGQEEFLKELWNKVYEDWMPKSK